MRLAALGVAAGLFGALTLTAPLAHAAGTGTDTDPCTDLTCLTTALAAQTPGDPIYVGDGTDITINLPAGTYLAHGTIMLNNVWLDGADEAATIIQAASDFVPSQYNFGDPAYTSDPIVAAIMDDVTLSNLTVKGQDTPTAPRLNGVAGYGVSLSLISVTVTDILTSSPGSPTGIAVVLVDGKLYVGDSTIANFQKNAITSWSDGDVRVTTTTITGRGKISSIAQNGIVIRGGTFDIDQTSFSDLWFDNAGNIATGVMVYDQSNWIGGDAVYGSISTCTFDGVEIGVLTVPVDSAGIPEVDTLRLTFKDGGYGLVANPGSLITFDKIPTGVEHPFAAGDPSDGQLSGMISVVFDTNGAGADNGSLSWVVTLPSGSDITAPDDPTWQNHTFTGWFDGADSDNELGFPINLSEDTTIYAQWESASQPESHGGQTIFGDTGGSVAGSTGWLVLGLLLALGLGGGLLITRRRFATR